MATETDIRPSISETCREEKGTEMLSDSSSVVLETSVGVVETLPSKNLGTMTKHIKVEDTEVATASNSGSIEGECFYESPPVLQVASELKKPLVENNDAAEVLKEIEVGEETKDIHVDIRIKDKAAEEMQLISKEEFNGQNNELNGRMATESPKNNSSHSAEGEVNVSDSAEEMKVKNVKEDCNVFDSTEEIPTTTRFSEEFLQHRISGSTDEKESETPFISEGMNTDSEASKFAEMKDIDTNKEYISCDASDKVTSKSVNRSDQTEGTTEFGESANCKLPDASTVKPVEETCSSIVASDNIYSEAIRSSDHLPNEHTTEVETSSEVNKHDCMTTKSFSPEEWNEIPHIADVGSNKDERLEEKMQSTFEKKSQDISELGETISNMTSEDCEMRSTNKSEYSGTQPKDRSSQKIHEPSSTCTVVADNESCSQNVTEETDTEPSSKVDLVQPEASTREFRDEGPTGTCELTEVKEDRQFQDDGIQISPEEPPIDARDEIEIAVRKEARNGKTVDADHTCEKQAPMEKVLKEEAEIGDFCEAQLVKNDKPIEGDAKETSTDEHSSSLECSKKDVEELAVSSLTEKEILPVKADEEFKGAYDGEPEKAKAILESEAQVHFSEEYFKPEKIVVREESLEEAITETGAEKILNEGTATGAVCDSLSVENDKSVGVEASKTSTDEHSSSSESLKKDAEDLPSLASMEKEILPTKDGEEFSGASYGDPQKSETIFEFGTQVHFSGASYKPEEIVVKEEIVEEETTKTGAEKILKELTETVVVCDSQPVESDKSVEGEEKRTSINEHPSSLESLKKDAEDLAVPDSTEKNILPAKAGDEFKGASDEDPEKSETIIGSGTQVYYSKMSPEREDFIVKEEYLEEETGAEKILNEGTEIGVVCGSQPLDKSTMIHEISETTTSGSESKLPNDHETEAGKEIHKQSTDEHGVTKELSLDTTSEKFPHRSLKEEEESEYTNEASKELIPQEEADELDHAHIKAEVESPTEQALSFQVVLPHHNAQRGLDDLEYSMDANIQDTLPVDIPGMRGVPENVVTEVEHEHVLHDSIKHSERKEESSTAVETEKEVAIAADHNTLRSSTDHEKSETCEDERVGAEQESVLHDTVKHSERKEDSSMAIETEKEVSVAADHTLISSMDGEKSEPCEDETVGAEHEGVLHDSIKHSETKEESAAAIETEKEVAAAADHTLISSTDREMSETCEDETVGAEREGVLHYSVKHSEREEESSMAFEAEKEVAIAADHNALISSMDHEKSEVCEDETVGAEHGGVVHDSFKNSELNEQSSMPVDADEEVPVTTDHITLISSMDHEKSDIGSSETCKNEMVDVEHGVLHDPVKYSETKDESSTAVETEKEVAIAADHDTLISSTDHEKSETCEDETVRAEHEGLVHDSIKHSDLNQMPVDTSKEVAVATDHNTLISSMDHEKSGIGSSETCKDEMVDDELEGVSHDPIKHSETKNKSSGAVETEKEVAIATDLNELTSSTNHEKSDIVPSETCEDETVDADYTHEKQVLENISPVDRHEEEDGNLLPTTAEEMKGTLPLVETKGEQVCEENQDSSTAPKHDAPEQNNIPKTSTVGERISEGALGTSDMDIAETIQVGVYKVETQSTLSSIENLQINTENDTEDTLQQHAEASDEQDGEPQEKEYNAEESSELQPQQSQERNFYESQAIENDKYVETGTKDSLIDDHSSSSKNNIDGSVRDVLVVKIGEEFKEAESEKILESVTQVHHSEVHYEIEDSETKEKSLEAETTDVKEEAEETTVNYISYEKLRDDDSCYDVTEKEAIQEEPPSTAKPEISETKWSCESEPGSCEENEVNENIYKESTNEGVVKGFHEDSTADIMLNESLKEKDERGYTDEALDELNSKENGIDQETEVKLSAEEVLSSDTVFPQHDSECVDDRELSIEKNSQAENVDNIDDSVIDVPYVKGVTENIEPEAGQESAFHETTKDSKINENSYAEVEKNNEIAVMADSNKLESLMDHEKHEIKPVETVFEENEASRGSTPEEIEDHKEVYVAQSSHGAFEEINSLQEEEQHSVIVTRPTEESSIGNDKESINDEKAQQNNKDQETVEIRVGETKHGEAENKDAKFESLSSPKQTSLISHVDEHLDLAKSTKVPPAIVELNTTFLDENEKEISDEPRPRESKEVIIPSAERDAQLVSKELEVTAFQDEIQKLETENDLNVALENDPIDCTSNQIIMPAEIKADSFSAIPDNMIPGQGDPEESIDTMISREDKDIQPDSATGIAKPEIEKLKDEVILEVSGSIKDEEAKEKNEDETAFATKAREIIQVDADSVIGVVKHEIGELKVEEVSEVAGSNKDEEMKVKNGDQAAVVTKAHEITQVEADSVIEIVKHDLVELKGEEISEVARTNNNEEVKEKNEDQAAAAVKSSEITQVEADSVTGIVKHEIDEFQGAEISDAVVSNKDEVKKEKNEHEAAFATKAREITQVEADSVIGVVKHEIDELKGEEVSEVADSNKDEEVKEKNADQEAVVTKALEITQVEADSVMGIVKHEIVEFKGEEISEVASSNKHEKVKEKNEDQAADAIKASKITHVEADSVTAIVKHEIDEFKGVEISVAAVSPKDEDLKEKIEDEAAVATKASEITQVEADSVTGIVKHEIDEFKGEEISEVVRSNKDEEAKEKNVDQAALATRAREITKVDDDSQSSTTEGGDSKVRDPDCKLQSISLPETSNKKYSDEPLDLGKLTEVAPNMGEPNEVSLAMEEREFPEEPPLAESKEAIITSGDEHVQLLQEDPVVSAISDVQKVETETDSDAAAEDATVEYEAKGATKQAKEIEQESSSIKPTKNSQSDVMQVTAADTIFDAKARETLDQQVEEPARDYEKTSNMGIEQKEELADPSNINKENADPIIFSGEKDTPQLQSGSVTVEREIDAIEHLSALKAEPEAERAECGDNAKSGEPVEEKGTTDDHNQYSKSSKSIESTESAPANLSKGSPKGTQELQKDLSSRDQHEDLNVVQHVQCLPTRRVQEGGIDDIIITQETEDLEGASLLPSLKHVEEADPILTEQHKNSTGNNNVPQMQEEAAAVGAFQAGGETPRCVETSFEEAKGEEDEKIIDGIEEETGEFLPIEITNTSTAEEVLAIAEDLNARSKIVAEKEDPDTENTERAENKEVKSNETQDEEDKGEVQTGEKSGLEVPLVIEKDAVDLTNDKITTRDESSCEVPEKKIQVQEDPDKSMEPVISSEFKDIQRVTTASTADLVIEEKKHEKASEAGREANTPENSTSIESAKSLIHDTNQASANETREEGENIDFQNLESLQVQPDSQVSSIETITKDGVDITHVKQESEFAPSLAPEKHIDLEADPRAIQEPKNSESVTQVQPETAAKDFQAAQENSSSAELDRESAIKEETTTEKPLTTDTTKGVASLSHKKYLEVDEDFNEGSKLNLEKDELHNGNAGAAEDETMKSGEDKEEVEEGDKQNGENKSSESPVIIDASRDVDAKTSPKKSHNILSGVGSKVKHSIAKVKKAITGKHSHPKPTSPKEGKGNN